MKYLNSKKDYLMKGYAIMYRGKAYWLNYATMEIYATRQKGRKMTRADQNAYECWDEENKEFDWEEYQKLCDIADYWDCEE